MSFLFDIAALTVASALVEDSNGNSDKLDSSSRADIMKSLVFVTGYNSDFDDKSLGIIEDVMKIVDKNFSARLEEQSIKDIYEQLKKTKADKFFFDIQFTDTKLMYFFEMTLVYLLDKDQLLNEQRKSNFSLTKKYFNFTREDITDCYRLFADTFEIDFDAVVDAFEDLTKDTKYLESNSKIYSKNSRTVTLICCLFFGSIGVHRFINGKIKSGIAQLILSGTGIGEIWAIIDFFTILFGGFKDADGLIIKYWK